MGAAGAQRPPGAIPARSRWPARAAVWPAGCGRSRAPTLRPGAALVLDTIGFDAAMRDSFAVVTGEGALDHQTLRGKAVFEVATRCRQGGVPVLRGRRASTGWTRSSTG